MSAALAEAVASYRDGWRPDPRLTVSEWADEFRVLSSVDSAEPGRWRTSRTPYLREIMDALSPWHHARQVVFDGGSQLGKTQAGNNWIGYTIHRSPAPMLMVQPTLEVGRRVSKQRIAPMIETTPALRGIVTAPRSRDSGNTTMTKEFPGGVLIITGANSASGLRSMPIERLFLDEVDEYDGDVGGQGDPVSLAWRRSSNFPRRKMLLTSTPTSRGFSRIEQELLRTDFRRYFVPCPHCGHMDFIQWSAGGWRGDEGIHHHIVFNDRNPDTAHLQCARNGCAIDEREKVTMLANGEWRATIAEPKRADSIGFHLPGLYSPLGWKSWAECATEFLEVKEDPFRLKTWVNTVLAETFEEDGDAVELSHLAARREHYRGEVPDGVGAIIISVDVQGDRLEAAVKGYGAGEESWLLAYAQFQGSPGDSEVWLELDEFVSRWWEHESGSRHRADAVVVDTGGAHTDESYRYLKARQGWLPRTKFFAIKGGSEGGKPLVSPPSTANKFRLKLWVLGVDAGKEMVVSRLQLKKPGPGYCHLEYGAASDEYLKQLTSERAVRKYVRGRGSVRTWEKITKNARNEAFDLEVYALAALHILGTALVLQLKDRARRWAMPVVPVAEAAAAASPDTPETVRIKRSRRPGWVQRF